MKYNKRSGFTLVELLVSISILGVISLISLPLIRGIQSGLKTRQYNIYSDSLEHSAKLYVDSYKDDLFKHDENGCVLIFYKDMDDKRLVKDISMDNLSCDTADTFVKVEKKKDKYTYNTYLGCGEKKDGHPTIATIKMPEKRDDLTTCTVDGIVYGKSYKLLFDDNGGEGCSGSYVTKEENQEWGNLCVPKKDGAELIEWNTKANGTGYAVTAETLVTSNMTVFAKWKENQVKIKFDANGGSLKDPHGDIYTLNGSKILKNNNEIIHTIVYGSSLTSDGLINWNNTSALNLTKSGYIAKDKAEWIISDGSKTYDQSKKYNASDFCDATHHDCEVTLKVNWESYTPPPEDHYVKIKLNANGGTLASKHGADYTLDGNKILKSNNEIIHTIKYGESLSSNGLLDWNNESHLNLTRSGYTVNKNSEWIMNGGTKTFSQQQAYASSEFCDASNRDCTVTLKVNWVNDVPVATPHYVYIRMNANGGSMATEHGSSYTLSGSNVLKDGSFTIHKVEYGSTVDLLNYNNPSYLNLVKSGYIGTSGAEWIKDDGSKTYSQSSTYNSNTFCDASGGDCTVTLKVNWKDNTPVVINPIYKITLDKQSGSGGTSTIYEKKSEGWYSNSGATTSISKIDNPTRSGYTFQGYYTSKNGGGTKVIDSSGKIIAGNSQFSSNATVYASWGSTTPAVSIYTITLDKQSGSGGTSTIYEKYGTGWYSNSGATTSISKIDNPTRSGYTFQGYYTSKNGGGTKVIDSSGKIIAGNSQFSSNATVYASWSQNTPVDHYVYIKMNANGGSLGTNHGSSYSLSGSTVLKDGSDIIHKIKYGESLTGYGLVNPNNSTALNIVKNGYRAVSGKEWKNGGNTYDLDYNYSASDFCDASTSDCTVTLSVNWEYGKPATPSINNPTNENWTNADFALTVSTTTPSTCLKTWYYSYNNTKFTQYNNSDNKSSFTTTNFTQERNQLVYIRVCNKNASSATDSSNCSDSASTYIRIDKTPPKLMNNKWNWIRIDQTVGGVFYRVRANWTIKDPDLPTGAEPSGIRWISQRYPSWPFTKCDLAGGNPENTAYPGGNDCWGSEVICCNQKFYASTYLKEWSYESWGHEGDYHLQYEDKAGNVSAEKYSWVPYENRTS